MSHPEGDDPDVRYDLGRRRPDAYPDTLTADQLDGLVRGLKLLAEVQAQHQAQVIRAAEQFFTTFAAVVDSAVRESNGVDWVGLSSGSTPSPTARGASPSPHELSTSRRRRSGGATPASLT